MGMMFGGWANDPYEQDERDLKKRLGPEMYAQLLKQREIDRKKWREEHPVRWSKSEPKVTEGDIIGNWDKESGKVLNEAVVKEITEEGEIVVRYLDNRRDGQPVIWEGEYQKMCSSINE